MIVRNAWFAFLLAVSAMAFADETSDRVITNSPAWINGRVENLNIGCHLEVVATSKAPYVNLWIDGHAGIGFDRSEFAKARFGSQIAASKTESNILNGGERDVLRLKFDPGTRKIQSAYWSYEHGESESGSFTCLFNN